SAMGLYASDAPTTEDEILDLASLNDVDTQRVGAAGIAPRDGVVTCGAATTLQEATQHRITNVAAYLESRHQPRYRIAIQDLGVDDVHLHGGDPACQAIELGADMCQREHATLDQHDVEIEFLAEPLVQSQSQIEDS